MKYFLYILSIFIFSCTEIQENSEALPYDFLISEGWVNFEENNLDMAQDLFLDVLDSDGAMVPYYSAAYLGLGWTKLYQARELAFNPINDFDDMYDLRSEAHNYFNLILEECSDLNQDNICDDFDIPVEIINDAYVGLAYSSSLMAIYEDFQYGENRYSCNSSLDGYQEYLSFAECANNCSSTDCSNVFLSLTESALEYSTIVLNNNPDYYFAYDVSNINANSIYILRAQLYIDLNDYSLAQNEISNVNFMGSNITFNLEDLYDDPYNSYTRFLYVGFEGDNNSKYFFPMTTEAHYDCSYSCDDLNQDICESSINCSWAVDEIISPQIGEFIDENENGVYDDGEELLAEFGACEGGEISETITDCESECVLGECTFLNYFSTVTRNFTPMLPCLDLIVDGVSLDEQDIIQCLESFPTNNLEYKFAVQFPSSILQGYQCSLDESDIITIYNSNDECLQSCISGECEIVDFDYANCQSQTELEFIDGVGCIDGYMYLMEEFINQECLVNQFREFSINESISPITLESSFGFCPSD